MRNLTRGGWLTGLVGGFLLAAGIVWAQEQLQLTTWYPAPRGDYQNLRVVPAAAQQADSIPDLLVNGMTQITPPAAQQIDFLPEFRLDGLGLITQMGLQLAPDPAGAVLGGNFTPVTGVDFFGSGDGLRITGNQRLELNVLDEANGTGFLINSGPVNFSMNDTRDFWDEVSITGAQEINLNVIASADPTPPSVRINGDLAAVYAVGTYASGAVMAPPRIEAGFRPTMVLVLHNRVAAPMYAVLRLSSMPVGFSRAIGPPANLVDGILDFDATGFFLGANLAVYDPVTPGTTYWWIAIGQ
ncbi:MAG: hypothetical protein HY597_03380 [Candidatus Omnitrophica bacterium]|nr:hypothetical protein [Candidatus Omnitrophota bacterium]